MQTSSSSFTPPRVSEMFKYELSHLRSVVDTKNPVYEKIESLCSALGIKPVEKQPVSANRKEDQFEFDLNYGK